MSVDYARAALAAARRYCGWVVTPPETVTVTVDGSGGRALSVPSLRVVEVLAVVEDGVELDVGEVVSASRGLLFKRAGGLWTASPAGVVVTMTHGFDEAPDFDAAVAQTAQALSAAADRSDPALTGKTVDDVEYQWSVTLLQSSPLNVALLAPYRILQSP